VEVRLLARWRHRERAGRKQLLPPNITTGTLIHRFLHLFLALSQAVRGQVIFAITA
jgi:hypothetical protein